MTFEEFEALAARNGLTAIRRQERWELRGQPPLLVEYWPDGRYRPVNDGAKPISGTPHQAIDAALAALPSFRHGKNPSDASESLWNVVHLAEAFVTGDEMRLCDMSSERAKVALELLLALRDVGLSNREIDIPF